MRPMHVPDVFVLLGQRSLRVISPQPLINVVKVYLFRPEKTGQRLTLYMTFVGAGSFRMDVFVKFVRFRPPRFDYIVNVVYR